jgi:hypothetical protein
MNGCFILREDKRRRRNDFVDLIEEFGGNHNHSRGGWRKSL